MYQRGVYLPELDLWLDSRRRREEGVISHAHSDHTARHQRPILTANTLLLLSDYLKNATPISLAYHEPLETEKYRLTLHPAGHCLGSAQVLVESKINGERLLYTGDIKVRPSPINEPLEAVPCDILVLEATYGQPQYTFPSQDQVLATGYRTLRTWLSRGEKPLVLVWRMGKAQEILHYLLAEGFDVAVEEGIYRVSESYQRAGVTFPGNFEIFQGRWPEGRVVLWPPGRRSTGAAEGLRGARSMELTGWAAGGGSNGSSRWGRRGDASLPFSDHPDFNELVEYVRRVAPKQVYTVNGFPELAAHLRGLGYPAVHLDGRGEHQEAGFQMKLL
ncbi:MAG: hypothetical protein BZY88_17575 [SAR202 cluster bacterium Io17-Chloro-G9]|nr:MAG: hypothetical protein BZY88_17575 [SAR202 cluster bacterium Io17-Chloro-G9]